MADGVWLLRGGVPRTMNVYLLEDEGGGVTLFDAGIRSMTHALAEAAAPLGGINRIVLGHADADHRGAAPGLHVPVFCHPADREAAGSSSPLREYHRLDQLGIPARYVYRHLLTFWDGGPVQIDGTVDEGDEVSGFRVVHLPGHAPGLIGLWRESDRLALDQRLLLRDRPGDLAEAPAGAAARGVQPGHRAGAGVDAQARRARPGGRLARPRGSRGGRRTRPARARRRVMARKRLKAPSSEYRSPDGDVLVLRGSMTPGTRREYSDTVGGSPLSQEDAWHRGVEFLFERLAVSWAVAGTDPLTRQKELLARFRMASQDERRWIRDVLREHLAEHFPDLAAP